MNESTELQIYIANRIQYTVALEVLCPKVLTRRLTQTNRNHKIFGEFQTSMTFYGGHYCIQWRNETMKCETKHYKKREIITDGKNYYNANITV